MYMYMHVHNSKHARVHIYNVLHVIVLHSDTLCVFSAVGTAVSVDPQVGGGADDSTVDGGKRCKLNNQKAMGLLVLQDTCTHIPCRFHDYRRK